ncbi:MAG: methyltransferase domain-containing protein [Novosphingobium sp.]|nr:methyltransferase domain-containing protein [Novosphingobium sp.]
MNAIHRQQIRDAFSAARSYDRHARVQRVVARRLARRIAELKLPDRPRILEIGCGTGFLTEALIAKGISGDWLVTDLSPAMVKRCREKIGNVGGVRFAVLDGEYGQPESARGFDLICSSMVMQWFDDPARALERMLGWLVPGGHCLFATLAAGSFAEWREAHRLEGLDCGALRLASVGELEAISPQARIGPLVVETLTERHDSARAFLHALKAIGAGTSAAAHRPLAPAELRRVMRRFEAAGARVTYEIVTGHYQRP